MLPFINPDKDDFHGYSIALNDMDSFGPATERADLAAGYRPRNRPFRTAVEGREGGRKRDPPARASAGPAGTRRGR